MGVGQQSVALASLASFRFHRVPPHLTCHRSYYRILDSGAFTELATHGRYRDPPEVYAEQITR